MRILRLLAIGVWAALLWQGAGEAAVFSHRRHVEKEELKCKDCHAPAWTSAKSGDDLLPSPAVCADCHDAGQVSTNFSAPPRAIKFSHQHHVETLKLACLDCHVGVDQMEAPAPVTALPGMSTCRNCHTGEMALEAHAASSHPGPTAKETGFRAYFGSLSRRFRQIVGNQVFDLAGAPRECETCHSQSRTEMKPESHQGSWVGNHGPEARTNDSSCLRCHRVSECQECHEGAQLSKLPSGLHEIPFASRMESAKGLVIQSVHGLNFRFLHGLEARGKSRECATCHELEAGNYCAQCHNPGGDPGLRPVWHGGPDWVPLQGGGRHARLARQDLENCISCHDLEGRDPTCQRCHRSGEEEEEGE